MGIPCLRAALIFVDDFLRLASVEIRQVVIAVTDLAGFPPSEVMVSLMIAWVKLNLPLSATVWMLRGDVDTIEEG
jgi:hypothetical protein